MSFLSLFGNDSSVTPWPPLVGASILASFIHLYKAMTFAHTLVRTIMMLYLFMTRTSILFRQHQLCHQP
ncbi:hypothetical protein VTN77DRAFT_2004 [Rasamsonia byssochlamydoides]|uniref:uncharacterized protein n=1 Tax=Rasamsonia byssochlamydoides TaxID=89139 RepID=UPI00374308E5